MQNALTRSVLPASSARGSALTAAIIAVTALFALAQTTYEGIVRFEDGTPAAGVRVFLYPAYGDACYAGYEAIVDAEGRFRIADAPQGAVWLTITAPTRMGNISYLMQAEEPADVEALPREFVIQRSAKLEIDVQMLGGRQPPESAVVVLSPVVECERGYDGTHELVNSKIIIDHMTEGTYRFFLHAPSFPDPERIDVELVRGLTTHATVVLDGLLPKFSVRVQNIEGASVPGATVNVLAMSRTDKRSRADSSIHECTSTNGVVTTYRLSEGTYQLWVAAEGYARYRPEAPHMLEGDCEVLVTLQKESAFLIFVREQDGTVCHDFSVAAREPPSVDTSSSRGGKSRSRNNRVPQLGVGISRIEQPEIGQRVGGLSEGRYRLVVRRRGELLADLEETIGDAEEKVVRIVLDAPTPIVGKVLINGEPAAGGSLMFRSVTEVKMPVDAGRRRGNISPRDCEKRVEVGEEGGFSNSLVRGGEYEIEYSTVGGVLLGSHAQSLPADTELALVFEAASIKGRVLMPTGLPADALPVELQEYRDHEFLTLFRASTDEEGRFAMEFLPPGYYRWNFPRVPAGYIAPDTYSMIEREAEIELRLREIMQLRLILTGEISTKPVLVYQVSPEGKWMPLEIVRDDGALGTGYFVDWPAGESRGLVEDRGHGFAYFTVTPGQDLVQVELTPGGLMVFTAYDRQRQGRRGQPIETFEIGEDGAEILVEEGVTYPSGGFCACLRPGKHCVRTTYPSGAVFSAEFAVGKHGGDEVYLLEPAK